MKTPRTTNRSPVLRFLGCSCFCCSRPRAVRTDSSERPRGLLSRIGAMRLFGHACLLLAQGWTTCGAIGVYLYGDGGGLQAILCDERGEEGEDDEADHRALNKHCSRAVKFNRIRPESLGATQLHRYTPAATPQCVSTTTGNATSRDGGRSSPSSFLPSH